MILPVGKMVFAASIPFLKVPSFLHHARLHDVLIYDAQALEMMGTFEGTKLIVSVK